jgi:hypothetical protein
MVMKNNGPQSDNRENTSNNKTERAQLLVVYFVFHGAYSIKRSTQDEVKVEADATSNVEHRNDNIRTCFIPSTRLAALDLIDDKIREDLRLTLDLFRQMSELCSGRSIEFVVRLIPTKESVFADYIKGNSNINNSVVIDQLLSNERDVNHLMKKFLDEHKVPYVDLRAEPYFVSKNRNRLPN